MHSSFVVVGGGPGGYSAAFMAADLGMEVTLVEQEPRLGGVCLLRGCIPSKALLHVAKVIAETRELKDWGIEFARPAIDVAGLRKRKDKVLATLAEGLKGLAKRRKVQVVQARAKLVNSRTLQLTDSQGQPQAEPLTFDHCLLAVGSRPVVPESMRLPSGRVMDSTGALELPEVPESLLVVGGGYIGLEMGTVYAELGSKVTVVELTDGLLPGVDRDLVKPLHQRLSKRLAAIHLNTKVASLADRKNQVEAVLEGPDGSRSERFDRVLVSIGRRPNSDDLGLENTRVTVNQRGFIEVDAQMRTNDPHLLAIGDVVGEPMLAHKAMHEGKVAVEALHGEPAVFDKLAIPAVVFTDPEIAWAGLTEEQARQAGREYQVAVYPWAASGRAQSLGRPEGLTKWLIDPATERLLGVGIVGPGAGELVAEGVLAIEMGCVPRDLSETIHPHPTLSETMGGAAETFFGTATEIYRPRRDKSGSPESRAAS